MKRLILILLLILTLALTMAGCKGKKANVEEIDAPTYSDALEGLKEGTLLIDYFEQPQAVPGDTHYSELVLYSLDAEHLTLTSYTRESEEAPEKEVSYIVPVSVYDEAMAAIDKAEMGAWKDHDDYSGITGFLYVTKFYRDGEYTRVTSEHMPDNGKESFWTVWSILSKNMKEENLVP
ncbi:MAG: hypothetical protein K5981_00320 [Clostridia bacterium]|nr:hypothetical protein [Clostridia bacterium]